MNKINCLAFAPHPDDAELFCSGLLLKLKKQGAATGIIDLTRGELSSNGNTEARQNETDCSSRILGIEIRENLNIPDGNIENTISNRLKVIKILRKLRPAIVLLPYWEDRHPDHTAASKMLKDSIFYSALKKIDTGQQPFRPDVVLHYMMHTSFQPSFCVDISDEMETKIKSINCFRSQFQFSEKNDVEATYINNPDFMESIIQRAGYYGNLIGTRYAEPFFSQNMLKIDNLLQFFS